ncbi:urease accessory protein UreF [Paenibacillus gallinarum]|uniref:Urease accessory protein UreF n=1 Tax=Paenibacillus gallinarum TaxID=2762232 RepID=A0ABR8SST5_9BACL|nr:urease accessory UreF family protein [Paenibacillus gallinarum]MBD7966556.1 urease accessory protein UreF [Paenibacillus gallinarum]
MNRGNKLLDYVKLLDSSLQVGGFSHSFGLNSKIERGMIRTSQDLETFMRLELYPSLIRIEGLAIKGTYTFAAKQDYRRIALIDKMLHVQHSPAEQRNSPRATGKRLIKLSKALHPWMDFSPLEKAADQYGTAISLPVVHAWINYQLGVPLLNAVSGYLHAAKNVCFLHARQLLSMEPNELEQLRKTLGDHLDQEWNKMDLSDASVFHRSRFTIHPLIPNFPFHEGGTKASRVPSKLTSY